MSKAVKIQRLIHDVCVCVCVCLSYLSQFAYNKVISQSQIVIFITYLLCPRLVAN